MFCLLKVVKSTHFLSKLFLLELGDGMVDAVRRNELLDQLAATNETSRIARKRRDRNPWNLVLAFILLLRINQLFLKLSKIQNDFWKRRCFRAGPVIIELYSKLS